MEAEAIELLKKIADVKGLDARLWDAEDVSTYLKLSTPHVRRFILTRGDFPAAVELPGKGAEPTIRYRPGDVRDWAETFRG